MTAQRDLDAVAHILAAGKAILAYTKGKRRTFAKDPILQDAVVRRFEVMGEATMRLTKEFREAHPQVPWRRLAGFRNVLIHGYDRVRPEEVLAAIDALPALLKDLQAMRP